MSAQNEVIVPEGHVAPSATGWKRLHVIYDADSPWEYTYEGRQEP